MAGYQRTCVQIKACLAEKVTAEKMATYFKLHLDEMVEWIQYCDRAYPSISDASTLSTFDQNDGNFPSAQAHQDPACDPKFTWEGADVEPTCIQIKACLAVKGTAEKWIQI